MTSQIKLMLLGIYQDLNSFNRLIVNDVLNSNLLNDVLNVITYSLWINLIPGPSWHSCLFHGESLEGVLCQNEPLHRITFFLKYILLKTWE
jgi:hypothetical protein